jgi:hypothetical protein
VQLVGADVADEGAHRVDVVIEREGAGILGHHARVDPVGDVDLVVLQQGAHGVAQQRGVMAGERRHHQHDGVVLQVFHHGRLVGIALEAQQPAEGRGKLALLDDRHGVAVRNHLADAELGLLVGLAEAMEQLIARRGACRAGQLREPASGIGIGLGGGFGAIDPGRQPHALHFVDEVKHG